LLTYNYISLLSPQTTVLLSGTMNSNVSANCTQNFISATETRLPFS